MEQSREERAQTTVLNGITWTVKMRPANGSKGIYSYHSANWRNKAKTRCNDGRYPKCICPNRYRTGGEREAYHHENQRSVGGYVNWDCPRNIQALCQLQEGQGVVCEGAKGAIWYAGLIANILQEVCKDIKSLGFAINPYDLCIANSNVSAEGRVAD